MRKYQLILIACLSVAAGQCWADEEQAQAPPDPAIFCYLEGKAYSEGAVEKNRILRARHRLEELDLESAHW